MPITLTPIKSSQLAALGHDPETNTLEVQFNGGARYRYAGVDVELFDRFRNAESPGKFFAAEIKANPKAYPYSKLDPQDAA